MAKTNFLKMNMPKMPKELAGQEKIKKAVDLAQKDFDAYVSGLKALNGSKKKAGKSQEALQHVLADYVDVEKDEKKIDIAVDFSEELVPFWHGLN